MEGISERDYYRTHPLTDERISFLEKASRESEAPRQGNREKSFNASKPNCSLIPKNLAKRFSNIRKRPFRPGTLCSGDCLFQTVEDERSHGKIDGLINEEPQNPYFWELKGQMLLETGKIDAAVSAYRQALKRQPASSLFKINLSQAMLENNPGRLNSKKLSGCSIRF